MSSYNGREVYERLVQAGTAAFAQADPRACSPEEIEKAAGVPNGSFERYFDAMDELTGVVLDRLAKAAMEDCICSLNGEGEALRRLDEMFSCWEKWAEQMDALRPAAGALPPMKGHILTCLDLYDRLAAAMGGCLRDAAAEGQCAAAYPEFAGRSLAFGLLTARYQGTTERELMHMVRSGFDGLLFGARAVGVARAC